MLWWHFSERDCERLVRYFLSWMKSQLMVSPLKLTIIIAASAGIFYQKSSNRAIELGRLRRIGAFEEQPR